MELLKRDLEKADRESTARGSEVQQLRIELQRYISEVGRIIARVAAQDLVILPECGSSTFRR